MKIKHITSLEELNHVYSLYVKIFKDKSDIQNPVYSLEAWQNRMLKHRELMIYATEKDQVIGICFGRVEDSREMIIGPVGVDMPYRGRHIASKMLALLEEHAKEKSITCMKLGALKEANKFYSKLGFHMLLLIQSRKHTLDEIMTCCDEYEVVKTHVYENEVNQVYLDISKEHFDIEKEISMQLPDCYTMMFFEKYI